MAGGTQQHAASAALPAAPSAVHRATWPQRLHIPRFAFMVQAGESARSPPPCMAPGCVAWCNWRSVRSRLAQVCSWGSPGPAASAWPLRPWLLLEWPSAAGGAATRTHCLAPSFTESATLCCVEGASLLAPCAVRCTSPVGGADELAWRCGLGLPVCGLTTTRQQAAPQEACASCSSCCRGPQGRQANTPATAAPSVWWGCVC